MEIRVRSTFCWRASAEQHVDRPLVAVEIEHQGFVAPVRPKPVFHPIFVVFSQGPSPASPAITSIRKRTGVPISQGKTLRSTPISRPA